MHVSNQIVSFAKRHSKTSHSKRLTKHHQASVPPSKTAFTILNALSHISRHFLRSSYVPENRHTLKDMRTTFSPLPYSPNPSTTVFLQKVIQQLNKCPASYGSRFITVFAGTHRSPLSWNQSNHTYLHTGINTRSAKNTNISNKFTLYHLVSFQQNYWKFLSTDGIN